MNKILIFCIFLTFSVGCQENCAQCKEFLAKNSNFKFDIDTEIWDVTKLNFSESMEYHLQSPTNTLRIGIYSSKNEYLSTSSLTDEMRSNLTMFHPNSSLGNPETLILNKKEFVVYNYETIDDDGEKIEHLYYEHIEPNESVGFLLYYSANDKIAQGKDFKKIISEIGLRST